MRFGRQLRRSRQRALLATAGATAFIAAAPAPAHAGAWGLTPGGPSDAALLDGVGYGGTSVPYIQTLEAHLGVTYGRLFAPYDTFSTYSSTAGGCVPVTNSSGGETPEQQAVLSRLSSIQAAGLSPVVAIGYDNFNDYFSNNVYPGPIGTGLPDPQPDIVPQGASTQLTKQGASEYSCGVLALIQHMPASTKYEVWNEPDVNFLPNETSVIQHYPAGVYPDSTVSPTAFSQMYNVLSSEVAADPSKSAYEIAGAFGSGLLQNGGETSYINAVLSHLSPSQYPSSWSGHPYNDQLQAGLDANPDYVDSTAALAIDLSNSYRQAGVSMPAVDLTEVGVQENKLTTNGQPNFTEQVDAACEIEYLHTLPFVGMVSYYQMADNLPPQNAEYTGLLHYTPSGYTWNYSYDVLIGRESCPG